MNVAKMYDELQGEIRNIKRKLAESGGGGGYSETELYAFSEATSVIELTEAYSDFDMISIRAKYTGAGSTPQYLVYTIPSSMLDIGSSYGLTSGNAYVWFNITDEDTLTITLSVNYRIENVTGIKF